MHPCVLKGGSIERAVCDAMARKAKPNGPSSKQDRSSRQAGAMGLDQMVMIVLWGKAGAYP